MLFIDARHIYRQVDRAHRDWTPAQIGFLANLVRLYRDEAPDLTVGGEETAAKLAEVFGKKPAYADVPGCAGQRHSKRSKRKAGRSTRGDMSASHRARR